LSPIFYITIGSGIGGGLIFDGEIYRGCGRGAAEIGHLRTFDQRVDLRPRGQQPVLKRALVPLEELASGWAIGQSARDLPASHDSELYRLVCGQVDRITAAQVGQAAS